jgi:cell division protein FtsB
MFRVSARPLRVVIIALVLFIGWDLTQRTMLTVRLMQAEQTFDQQIARAEATHTALVEQKKLVQTDAYIEDKLRREQHYVRDGETLVIMQVTPVAPKSTTPPPPPSSSANWILDFLQSLFGP